MKKADLQAVFGTYEQIGAVFAPANNGIPLTKGAIGQWGEEIPELREYQLRELVPDIDDRIEAAKKVAAA